MFLSSTLKFESSSLSSRTLRRALPLLWKIPMAVVVITPSLLVQGVFLLSFSGLTSSV